MIASIAVVHGCGSVSIDMSRSKRIAGIVPALSPHALRHGSGKTAADMRVHF